MQRITSAIGVVLGVAIIVIAGAALVYGVIEDPAVVGPLTAALVVVIVALLQRRWEKRQELERLHREQMTPLYKQLVETVKDIQTFAQKPENEQEAFFKDLATKLILNGPTPIVKAWNGWQLATQVAPESAVALVAYEDLLLAIREDLGHDNSGLGRGELLRLFVNEEDDEEHARSGRR
jgi:hypothetical protein